MEMCRRSAVSTTGTASPLNANKRMMQSLSALPLIRFAHQRMSSCDFPHHLAKTVRVTLFSERYKSRSRASSIEIGLRPSLNYLQKATCLPPRFITCMGGTHTAPKGQIILSTKSSSTAAIFIEEALCSNVFHPH